MKMKIAICYEVCRTKTAEDKHNMLEQAQFVHSHLSRLGHSVKIVPYGGQPQDFIGMLRKVAPDVVWNLFETFSGSEESSYMGAMLLDSTGIPFTGSNIQALMFCADKTIVGSILYEAAISTPFQYVPGVTENLKSEMARLNVTKWVLKSAKRLSFAESADNAIIFAPKDKDIIAALQKAPITMEMYAEQYIQGRDFTVSLLDRGHGLVPIAVSQMKIVNNAPKRSFNHEYEDRFVVNDMMKIASEVAAIVDLSGFANIKFRYDGFNTPYVTGVIPHPRLDQDSGFIAACRRVALPPEKALEAIVNSAKNKKV
jgi:hypothetical protein